jgi:hypothetical protein
MFTDWFQLVNWNVSNTSIPSVSPTQGGWSRVFNYTVGVYDQEGDTVNCSLFISTDNQASWTYKGSYIVSGTPGIPTQGTCWKAIHDFNCSNIDKGSNQKWFKWQIVNGNPTHAWNTTPIQGPILNESNVNVVLVEGDTYQFNRSSGSNQVMRLAVNVYDTENSTFVNNSSVSFWITNDNSNYRLERINVTNSLGNASYYFDPNCTHTVGKQYWIAGVTDSCYQDMNTSSNYTLNITGDLKPIITSPNGKKYLRGNYPDGENVTIRGNVTDECNLNITNAYVNFSATKTVTQYCNPVIEQGLSYYNCSLNTSGFSAQGWNVNFNFSTRILQLMYSNYGKKDSG